MGGSGPLLFARYALPPNVLGYCGPDGNELWDQASAIDQEDVEHDLRRLGRAFDGALPYLELIAETTGIGDPFDRRVVHAYWIGNPLLDRVPLLDLGNALRDRFHGRMGSGWIDFTDQLTTSSVPHHSFHVLCVYPWVGLLRSGAVEASLRVLDRCRIRTGTVVEVFDEYAAVTWRPLRWSEFRLEIGTEEVEVVQVARGSSSLIRPLVPGDVVSMHWDWVCDIVTADEAAAIDGYLRRHLDDVNGVSRAPRPVDIGS